MRRIAVVGAGFSGAVVAREIVTHTDARVTVFESRDHPAGNCHTARDHETGVMVHNYGAHIFNTNRDDVWDYVRRFGDWEAYTNRVKATTDRGVFSLPVNLLTINQFFGKRLTPREAREFIREQGDDSIDEPRNFEEQALKFLGRALYENFFYGYTKKQWGCEPRELPASILKRLPVRFDYNDSYYTTKYQAIPHDGYTAVVQNLLDDDAIEVLYSRPFERTAAGEFDHVFYSGPIDAFYGCDLGRLAYRTVTFERWNEHGAAVGNAVMNFCSLKDPHTRLHEHKFLTPWEDHRETTLLREFSQETGPSDEPYYPKRLPPDKALLQQYLERAKEEPGVTFLGRLGTYRYLNMDQVIGEALDLSRQWLDSVGDNKPPPHFHEAAAPTN